MDYLLLDGSPVIEGFLGIVKDDKGKIERGLFVIIKEFKTEEDIIKTHLEKLPNVVYNKISPTGKQQIPDKLKN